MEASHVAMLDGDYDKADGFLARTTGFGDVKIEPGLLQVRQCIFGLYSALLLQLRGRCEDAVRVARRSAAAAPTRPRGIEITAIPEIEITKITCAAILGLNGKMSEAEAILADQARDAHEQYRRDLAAWVAAALVDPSAEPSQEAVTRANGIIILLRRAITAAQKQAVSLTPAESRVLRSLSEGRASKEVAAMTGRSVKTVDNQIAAILRKLGARSRGEAVARARRVGLLQGEPAESVRA
jgi:DNA-binding CsgD family transcriptional regulator